MTKIFRLILLAGFVVCLLVEVSTKNPTTYIRQKWDSDESAYITTKRGDLATFSMFVRQTLFKRTDINYSDFELLIPNRDNHDKSQFIGMIWKTIPDVYLFPLHVNVSEDYTPMLSSYDFELLKESSTIQKDYHSSFVHQKRKFYILQDLDYFNHKQWAVYSYKQEKTDHIFLLPLNFEIPK